jgi:hypothetical protein
MFVEAPKKDDDELTFIIVVYRCTKTKKEYDNER